MDFNRLIARVKNILLTPKTEWPVIAAEPDSVVGLYQNYIVILAALPVVASFVKMSIIGTSTFGVSYRESFGSGLERLIVTYIVTLGLVYVSALIANALAPNFGAQKDQTQALKAVAYGWTASWVAGITMLLGAALGGLICFLALIYAIYLLNLGLKETMKCPPEKAAGYTGATVGLTFLVAIVVGVIVLRPLGLAGFGGYSTGGRLSSADGSVQFDKNSTLGALAAIGQQAEQASKKMEAAKQSGDTNAQAAAAGQMIGAVLGGGSQVEALAPDALKPFVPDTLAGLPRTSLSVQKQSPIGVQISVATAKYANASGTPSYELTVSDMGGAKGLMALAGFANLEEEKQTDSGYEKTYHQNGRLIHEEWNKSGSGEFTIILGDRFIVAVKGSGVANVDALKAAVAGLNLAGLEALKGQGVKNG